jgi:hypothetical protein
MGEISFTTGLILTGLFSICIVVFAINFANDNSSQVNLASDSDFNSVQSNAQSDLIDFSSAVNSSSTTFTQENVEEGTDTATSGGQFKVTASSSLGLARKNVQIGFNKIFGTDFTFVFLALISLLILMFIRYQYKTWFGKDPD